MNLTDKILLVGLAPWGVDTPPLALACLSTSLRNANISTEVFDMNIELYNAVNEQSKYLWSMNYSHWWREPERYSDIRKELDVYIEPLIKKILSFKHKIVGFSLSTNCSDLLLEEIVKRIKTSDPDKVIILGGVSISINEQRNDLIRKLRTQIDYCVIGEGEEVLVELVKKIASNKLEDIGRLPGIIKKGEFEGVKQRAEIKDFNSLPFPTFEEFNLKKYKAPVSLPMEFSRGCVGSCPFCDFKSVSSAFKSKAPYYIISQIKFYKEKYNIIHMSLSDPAVNGDIRVLEQICDLLIEANLSVNINSLAIPRKEMTLELLERMKKAGFYRLEYGLESGSNKILKAMRKIFTVEIAEKVIRDTYQAGIKTYLYLIVGYPQETEDDLNQTKDFLNRNRQYISMIKSINPLYVMAGSEIFCNPDKYQVTLPAKDSDKRWFIGDKNTYSLRKARIFELKKVVASLNIPFTEEAESLEFTGNSLNKQQGIVVGGGNPYDKDESTTENKIMSRGYAEQKTDKYRDSFLLINLPPWGQENPHIGVGYVCSYLRHKGFKPSVLDLNKKFYLSQPNFQMLWHVENKNFWSNQDSFPLILKLFKKEIDKAINDILSSGCSLLGFSVVDPKEKITIEFIRRIKRRDKSKKIILGGPATSTYEQRKIFLDNVEEEIDTFVIGEGEQTLFKVVDRILKKKELKGIEGCCSRDNGKWVCRESGEIVSLDKIPFPTYEEFDLSLYGKSFLVEWSRGCRSKCAFCKNYRLFSSYRSKSAESVMKELRYHKQKYNVDEFTVVDNILNGDLNTLNDICDRIIKENLQIRWTGQIAPRKDMNFEYFQKMKQAGCFKLQIGLESGSNKVLKLMHKSFTAEISEKNIIFAKKAGIETEIFTMIGFPGEAEKDFQETYDFIKRNAKYLDTIKSINTLHLIAGTEIYEQRERFKIKPLPQENWHYLWETYEGNTYKVREERAKRILGLACDLKIKVMETNIIEGKEQKVLLENLGLLEKSLNSLQELPEKEEFKLKRRNINKWLILIFVSFYTFFYIIYFWVFMIFRNKVLLGGRKK
ncbi:MAG: radical SAM protein [Candidatus Omnitrophica bacterium]|nr:radical SAM protein [Candidatus Omnitrophota bacterium]